MKKLIFVLLNMLALVGLYAQDIFPPGDVQIPDDVQFSGDLPAKTESRTKRIIIINNNIDNSNESEHHDNSDEHNESEHRERKRKLELGKRVAMHILAAYGSITAQDIFEQSLRNRADYSWNDLRNYGKYTLADGYLRFFHASVGLSYTADLDSPFGLGIYTAARLTMLDVVRYPGNYHAYDFRKNTPIWGAGFNIGPYARWGMWGDGGGIGTALYYTMTFLGRRPEHVRNFALAGLGMLTDVFITGNFGISAGFELMFLQDKNKKFYVAGESFSLGIILGLS